MERMNVQETKAMVGGVKYVCRWCGYSSSNYLNTYANALRCVNQRFGKSIYNIVEKAVSFISKK